jgi:hypothetical protein
MGIISVNSKAEGYKNIIKSQSSTIQEMRDEIILLKAKNEALSKGEKTLLEYINKKNLKWSQEGILVKSIDQIEKASKLAYKYIPKLKVNNMPNIKIKFK